MDTAWSREIILDRRVRYLGVFVMACWVFHATYNVGLLERPATLLWMCHVATFLLGVGLLGSFVGLIRLTTAWTILGLPIWLIDVMTVGTTRISVLSHLLVPVLAVVSLSQARMPRPGRTALYGLGLMALMQLICRVATPPALNVNLAHRPYPFLGADIVSSPAAYWVITSSMVLVVLFGINKILEHFFPLDAEYQEVLGAEPVAAPANAAPPADDPAAEALPAAAKQGVTAPPRSRWAQATSGSHSALDPEVRPAAAGLASPPPRPAPPPRPRPAVTSSLDPPQPPGGSLFDAAAVAPEMSLRPAMARPGQGRGKALMVTPVSDPTRGST
jgi:hypothetical protein